MEFGIFNLMNRRDRAQQPAQMLEVLVTLNLAALVLPIRLVLLVPLGDLIGGER